jgi:hypothetical protein
MIDRAQAWLTCGFGSLGGVADTRMAMTARVTPFDRFEYEARHG